MQTRRYAITSQGPIRAVLDVPKVRRFVDGSMRRRLRHRNVSRPLLKHKTITQQNEKCIAGSQQIIEHHTKAVLNRTIDVPNWWWLDDIEETKNEKSP